MIHDRDRVEEIRHRATAKLEALAKLDGKITTPEFVSQFRLALHWLNDVEHLFVGDLSRNDRTGEQESMWLAWTEEFLSMAEKQAAKAESLFKEFAGRTIW